MDILIVVGAVIIGFSLGWNLRERVAVVKANRMLAELEQEIEQESQSDVVKITIEKDNGILFAYHKDSNQFITQANDRKELEAKLAELFPGKTFGVTPKNLIEIGFTS
jgi:predicted PhzF superfamily epimerase YddE/YHI9